MCVQGREDKLVGTRDSPLFGHGCVTYSSDVSGHIEALGNLKIICLDQVLHPGAH
jgi:hypothetical protein